MAKKEDRKKQKKREKERKKAAAQSRHAAAKAKLDRYPKILLDTAEGNGYFVADVRAVVEETDFDSPEMGPEWMRTFYRQYHSEGLRPATMRLKELEEEWRQRLARPGVALPPSDALPRVSDIVLHLGERIFAQLPIQRRQLFLPMNDFSVNYEKGDIVLRFTSLREEPGEWGTVFYSRRLPKVEVGGKRVTVAFSRHAIEQMCARRTPRYLNFASNGDAHAYLARCVYHEIVPLADGSPAIKLFDVCDMQGFRVYRDYVLGVFGEENRRIYGGSCHYILGYCPIVLENGFAKAKSFLYPGFRGTPERRLLEGEDEQRRRYADWLEKAEDEDSEPFFETPRAVEVAKWFHTHGIPQVIQMPHTVIQE